LDYGRKSKLDSWDHFGPQYWELAAMTSHPSPHEVAQFLAGVTEDVRVLIIGATTRVLVAEAIARKSYVTVMDFAPRLIEKLRSALQSDRLAYVRHDIGEPVPPSLQGHFDLVASDRLINRFHCSEMPRVCANMGLLARPGGRVRMTARLGLYPLDEALIQEGRKRGTLNDFWEEQTLTIDWSRVGEELEVCATSHGQIPREVVIEWSRQRGIESRISDADVRHIISGANEAGILLELLSVVDMDVAPNTKLYDLCRSRIDGPAIS
jgi:hypothetical protein